ncbi:transposase [Methanocalculus sp. MSAO_Arc2]|uniref:RNA-guided endonuclease InsQ/TnpB family protein n=1 Tax=Methanocalculus sp. MSAO_Arc2 TaxID=2293855 RepID=UPI003217B2CB
MFSTPTESRREGRSIGIDAGLNSSAVDSDGAVIENPRFYERSLNTIRKLQRSISRKQRFSKNWNKAESRLEKAHDHVTNQKRDFLHTLSRSYVDRYRTICVEDPDIKGLKETGCSKGLHRNIHDSERECNFTHIPHTAHLLIRSCPLYLYAKKTVFPEHSNERSPELSSGEDCTGRDVTGEESRGI